MIKSKLFRRTIYSILILIVLFVGSGVLYIYYTDTHNKTATLTEKLNNTPQYTTPKPTAPSPNAPEGAAVESITSPVTLGSNSALTVNTNAGSKCSISVTYNGVASTDSGLVTKQADAYGTVTWTWTVGTSTPVGSWPVKVTCIYNGRSAVVQTTLQVTH